jgi:hypothetical protein
MVFAVIGAGVATGFVSIEFFLISGHGDWPGDPGPTTWPIGVVLIVVSVVLLRVGFRNLRYLTAGQALAHLILGVVSGLVVAVAFLSGGFT